MILISTDELVQLPYKARISVECDACNKIFQKQQSYLKRDLLKRNHKHQFCSLKCVGSFYKKIHQVTCKTCGKSFQKKNSEITRSPNSFCNASCAAKYNNTHKTKGTRRSKLEVHLSEILPAKYSNLEFHFNRTDAVNAELDIFIPNLQTAFELNGIFHYEPIYGSEKLQRIQNNDNRKFQACLEKKIELYVINVSSMNCFKLEKAQEFINAIIDIIDLKLKKHE